MMATLPGNYFAYKWKETKTVPYVLYSRGELHFGWMDGFEIAERIRLPLVCVCERLDVCKGESQLSAPAAQCHLYKIP